VTRLVVIGDTLVDRDVDGDAVRLAPDAPAPVLDEREVRARPGGAGLAAVLAARDGAAVTLVTALGDDGAGAEAADLLARAGVAVVDLGSAAATPEKIRLRADGTLLARWDRGTRATAADIGAWTAAAQAAVDAADGVLVSCYGRGLTAVPAVRRAVGRVAADVPVTWDPHPRGAPPVPGCRLVTPNDAEATGFVPDPPGEGLAVLTARADALVGRWGATAVAVTRGRDGALVSTGGGLPLVVPAPRAAAGDACGAGDRFAAAAALALARGEVTSTAAGVAVHAASRFVAAGGAAAVDLDPSPLEPTDRVGEDLARAVRGRGGTVVATGGCFDLVHAGHVHLLQAARALGDCLIVCLNSDTSVRRLKGARRPIVPEADRRQLLEALACVDAVVVFDDDTPVDLLRRLRPHVFVKGGDYGNRSIPESAVLAEWDGQAVTLPYLGGRSTTRILEEVRSREAS
jgi:D-beta-D-heptose 7-phosphate kinase / D-beta-D-heptose 1-phosphate adenosyltransferase